MNKYLVVWEAYCGIFQSVVETDKNPDAISMWDWAKMAAETEEIEIKDSQIYSLFLVIDYPNKIYV